MHLIQVGKKPISENISGVGLFTFRPGIPEEVRDAHLAGVLMERLAWCGLTAVPERKVNGLPVFDIESAKEIAGQALTVARKALVERYIEHQLATRVRQGLPPLPPSPTVQEIIEEDGWDLGSYGIKPVGWKVEGKAAEQDKRLSDLEKSNQELQEANKQLGELNKELMVRMDLIMNQLETGGKKK